MGMPMLCPEETPCGQWSPLQGQNWYLRAWKEGWWLDSTFQPEGSTHSFRCALGCEKTRTWSWSPGPGPPRCSNTQVWASSAAAPHLCRLGPEVISSLAHSFLQAPVLFFLSGNNSSSISIWLTSPGSIVHFLNRALLSVFVMQFKMLCQDRTSSSSNSREEHSAMLWLDKYRFIMTCLVE